jgi:predicted CXXCH cytochrome family protein
MHGQQRDEDYTWGSFRQSKMFQQGVTCMDCHEPHTIKLRAQGNTLCTRCHNAEKFDTEKHHFHKADSKGALCMDCHAPEQNYMVNDGRLGLIESVDPINRTLSASPLLADPIRGVRIEAARVLADIPDSQMSASRLESRNKAMQEYKAAMTLNADWPSENSNLGNLSMRQGKIDEAITAYQRALSLDPRFVGAYINLADAYRQQKRDDEGEKQLRNGLALVPDAADLHHALGLLLVRNAKNTEALNEFLKAVKLAPDNARYAYVYAIALNSVAKQREALAVLKAADSRNPYNLAILSALISIQREAGDNKSALIYARKAAEALPDNPEIQQLITELEGVK